ncbi:hypothetical protein BASA81_003575 [Batrachochytrium salamandrivorans]|nr:hypothetical protein BASA81_003575 [Batrachochytrium salamandrivorans]
MWFQTRKRSLSLPESRGEKEEDEVGEAGEDQGLTSGSIKLASADVFFSKRVMVLVVSLVVLVALIVVFASPPPPPPPPPPSPLISIPKPGQDDENILGEDDDDDADEEDQSIDCTEEGFAQLETGTYPYKLRLANCGGKTTTKLPISQRPFRVFLVGEDIRNNLHLSGCPPHSKPGGCPLFPKCTFSTVKHLLDSHKADMMVVASGDHELAKKAAVSLLLRKPIRVLYQREPYWHFVDAQSQMRDFDLTMTGFVNAGVMNPPFLRRPARLLAKPIHEFSIPFGDRPHFALSIISLCSASSLRKIYLTHLTDYLGKKRVHQYGKCGNLKLPPPPVTNAIQVIAQYKFFLAFENSLLTNYISEKLLTVLTMPLIPVYRGGLPSLNITRKKSFIDVSDFASPKQLAIYLLRLDANPDEYAQYHEWRTDPEPFTDQYLELAAKQLPGKAEMEPLKHEPMGTRRAMCCRLCDPDVVAREMELHDQAKLIPARVHTKSQLNKLSFGGNLGTRHPGSLLVPGPNGTFVESGKREKEEDYDE